MIENLSLPPLDAVEVSGLSVILDEENLPPFLQLELRCGGKLYRAGILAAEEDWALTVRDEEGHTLFEEDRDLYPTQSSAILAAMLMAIEAQRIGQTEA